MKRFYQYLAFIVCIMLCMALALPAAASESNELILNETETEGTLTISYIYEDEDGVEHALKYVDFDLYLVASLTENYTLSTTENFSEIDIPQDLFYDQDLLIETRNALEQFVNTNPITPDYVVTTNGVGKVTIDLPLGLYYINTELFWDDENSGETISAYYSTPFLVLVGAYDPETGDYIYDYTAYPKISTLSLTGETLSVSVQKIWENTEYTTIPDEIQVALYCDSCNDGITNIVTLNAENNWSYTWAGLDATNTWAVCEVDTLTDYTVQYETQVIDGQFMFVITNTFTGEPDPTPKPDDDDDDDEPTPTPPPPPPPPSETLPQTGSNLPYVPVCAGIGLSFLFVGALLTKGGGAK